MIKVNQFIVLAAFLGILAGCDQGSLSSGSTTKSTWKNYGCAVFAKESDATDFRNHVIPKTTLDGYKLFPVQEPGECHGPNAVLITVSNASTETIH